MAYSEKMSSSNPGLIIILIDQSYSMNDPYGSNGEAKKDLAAKAVNRVIFEIMEASADGEKYKDRVYIMLVGYGLKTGDLEIILNGFISEISNKIIRTEKIKRKVSDGAGGLVEIEEEFPIWVEPKAEYGTPMDLAFKEAYKTIETWCNANSNSFPPLVINITDGEPNDFQNTEYEANKITSLSTNDGNVLLLNAHIADGNKESIKLPNDVSHLSDPLAKFLFDISSILPDPLVDEAKKVGFNVKEGARGMVYNADADILIRLLNFGSSVAR